MKKTVRMELRLTADEKNIIWGRAKFLGISRSKYVVCQAIAKPWQPTFYIETKIDQNLLWQIQCIGNNLNQIARALNLVLKIGGSVSTIRTLAELEIISTQIRELPETIINKAK